MCFTSRASFPRLWPRLYGQFVVDGDNPDRKRCSLIVSDGWKTILPTRHRVARHRAVRPQDLARESFISTARVAPVLRTVIDDYAAKEGITLKQNYDAETLSGGMSLVASTGGFTLLPLYV